MKKIFVNFALILFAQYLLAAVYTGSCGTNATWSFDTENGELTISGSGVMRDYTNEQQPWYTYHDLIKSCTIGSGITHLSNNIFQDCSHLKSVQYPQSLDTQIPDLNCVQISVPTVNTNNASDIGETSATIWGEITGDGGGDLIECGFYYDLTTNPLINGTKVILPNAGIGTFSTILTGLSSFRKYYFVAYVTSEAGTSYGNTKQFTMGGQRTGELNGHDWVDLGLSVRWATCNIGAESYSQPGDYFMWGYTTPGGALVDNYKFFTTSQQSCVNGVIKYNKDSILGTVDNLLTLLPEDDAAHVNWGDSWRMPTVEEFQELIDNCTWEHYLNQYIRLTSKINGQTIVFMKTGMDGTINVGVWAHYWTSSLSVTEPELYYQGCVMHGSTAAQAWVYHPTSSSSFLSMHPYMDRHYSFSIRAVCPK